jgi:ribosomal protein L6P/L9E
MVTGVTEGYQKTLEIVGVGYNCKAEGKKLLGQACAAKIAAGCP